MCSCAAEEGVKLTYVEAKLWTNLNGMDTSASSFYHQQLYAYTLKHYAHTIQMLEM